MIIHNKPTIGFKELNSIKKIINNGNLTIGNEVKNFEKKLANFLKTEKEKIVVVNSASAALFLALTQMLNKRSKVAIPVYGCSSLYQAAKLANLNIIYFDICSKSQNFIIPKNIDFDAIVIPHLFGLPNKLQNINKKKLIEDCSQSFGAKINKTYVGTNGRFGIFSFKSTKLFTSGGQGGAIFCNYIKDAEKIREFINYDMKSNLKSGFNFIMTDLNAAIGNCQLERFKNEFIQKRKKFLNIMKIMGLFY